MTDLSTKRRQTIIYHQRINAVINYVRAHLEDELPLATLAAVAGFSPFHFHRLFKAMIHDTHRMVAAILTAASRYGMLFMK